VSQRLRLPYQQDMRRRACLLAPRPPWHSAPPPARAAGRAPWPQRPVRPQPKEWTMPAAAAGGEAGSALGKAFLSGLVPHQEAALDIAKGQNPKVMAWLPPSSRPAEGGRRHDGIASAGCGSRPRRPTAAAWGSSWASRCPGTGARRVTTFGWQGNIDHALVPEDDDPAPRVRNRDGRLTGQERRRGRPQSARHGDRPGAGPGGRGDAGPAGS